MDTQDIFKRNLEYHQKEKTPNYVFFARIARAAQEKLVWGEINGD